MGDTKPRDARFMNCARVRDAGEVARQIPIEHLQRLGFPAARVDYGVTVDLLAAWRREIEAARDEHLESIMREEWARLVEIYKDAGKYEAAAAVSAYHDAIRDRFGGGE